MIIKAIAWVSVPPFVVGEDANNGKTGGAGQLWWRISWIACRTDDKSGIVCGQSGSHEDGN